MLSTYAIYFLILVFFALYGLIFFIIHMYRTVKYYRLKSRYRKVISTKHLEEIKIKE